jgi:tetratricopeptide (TPR) repeat protein
MATRSEAARRHASHYLAVLERLGERPRDHGRLALEVEREWPQIRRAREWAAAVADDPGRATLNRGFTRSAATALTAALAMTRERGERADAAAPPASLENGRDDLQLALSLSRHALAISLQDGDAPEQVRDYATLGGIYCRLGDHAQAAECFRKAIEVGRALPHPHHIPLELVKLAALVTEAGRLDAAYEMLAGALRTTRAPGGEEMNDLRIPRFSEP